MHWGERLAPEQSVYSSINIESGRKLALPDYSVHTATKFAVETLTNTFAEELRGRNIAVNATAPEPTATDLFLKHKIEEWIENP